jgi:hypothetical protein
VAEPPFTTAGFVDWAEANPGRFTHPVPANFMGATFLKQALIELLPDPRSCRSPRPTRPSMTVTAPLWGWYDALRPNLWQEGRTFPENESLQQQMLNDGVVDFAMYFDPAAPAAAIAQGLLPETVRVLVPDGGTIGNVSFVAIPYNAANKEGAMVVANFLLDPATQARMQNIEVLGSFSVLDPAKLSAEEAALFDALPSSPPCPARGPRPHARRAASELDDPHRRGMGDAATPNDRRRPAPPRGVLAAVLAGIDRARGARAVGDGARRLRDPARHRGRPPVARALGDARGTAGARDQPAAHARHGLRRDGPVAPRRAGAAAALHARPRLAARLLAPFLAAPHAAIAIGLAFVIAPSGWIARALSPWATGWETPPDLATVHDPGASR